MAFVKSEKSQNELLVSFLRGKNRTISAPQAEALFGHVARRAQPPSGLPLLPPPQSHQMSLPCSGLIAITHLGIAKDAAQRVACLETRQ